MSRQPHAHRADRLRNDVVSLLWFLAFAGIFVAVCSVTPQ